MHLQFSGHAHAESHYSSEDKFIALRRFIDLKQHAACHWNCHAKSGKTAQFCMEGFGSVPHFRHCVAHMRQKAYRDGERQALVERS